LADTAEIDAKLREESLRKLARAIQGRLPPDELLNLRDSFIPLQKNQAERKLIESLPSLVDWLNAGNLDGLTPSSPQTLSEADKSDIRAVMEKINRGQLFDVQRFRGANGIRALTTAAELDEYTYLVAGCVGEFWTDLCFRHLPKFADRSAEKMRELGRSYGQGLQLINILRDAGSDLRHGRCYFPEQELRQLGVAPNELSSAVDQVAPIFQKWRRKAEEGTSAGIDYSCAICNVRVRFATAIPALIGARTLALLREAGADALRRSIKVPRGEVRAIMSSTTLSLASPRALRKKFQSFL
jgi:farnesyl-diphosphate farnesyltransferase